jgi:hypothetical protein
MATVSECIRRRGGIAATHQLYDDGHTRDSLRRAVRRGEVTRVRQGWYAIRGLPDPVVEAACVGGILTCVSSLKLQGFWVVDDTDLHVAVLPNACRLRTRTDKQRRLADSKKPRTRAHWRSEIPPGSQLLLSPLPSLADMIKCKDAETAAVSADSVLHSHPYLTAGWRDLVARAPESSRPPARARGRRLRIGDRDDLLASDPPAPRGDPPPGEDPGRRARRLPVRHETRGRSGRSRIPHRSSTVRG